MYVLAFSKNVSKIWKNERQNTNWPLPFRRHSEEIAEIYS